MINLWDMLKFAGDSLAKRDRAPSLIFITGGFLLCDKSPLLCYSMLLNLLYGESNDRSNLSSVAAPKRDSLV